ncbi:nitrite/sulfite reductase [Rhodocyclus tenuis]|uniref:nitrite/sulfite reductase n=1 Tax=Rhodocyclus tenuis TaxID=1066 RepID=UPI001907DB48|nr:nitrite/sulfite reductase [Rhodocyclus tenuis]MBK1680961.1 sulfite reductase [Rhodocyclus tenuis]
MYQYDDYDKSLIKQRVEQYRDQLARYQRGALSDEEFLPLRLQNGVYKQRHSHMLRVAIPYGALSARQMRALAEVSTRWDRGFAHFTTRHNVQFNWVRLEDTPDVLAYLAEFEMHAIQTSGNCVRGITTDAFAGMAADEVVDPRPFAELLRQWATLHPEFAFLPRKFKIAITGALEDRVLLRANDVGLQLHRNAAGEIFARVFAGGGLGRTPVIGSLIRAELPWQHLLSYITAIVRVFNRYGRRDNKYKARLKILLQALGAEHFIREIESEWQCLKDGPATLTESEYRRVAACFETSLPGLSGAGAALPSCPDKEFVRWRARNVAPHKNDGYANVSLSSKPGPSAAPGDLTNEQMRAVADWADRFCGGEIRVSHEQHVVLAGVRQQDLHALWLAAKPFALAAANVGLITDIMACPGTDFCDIGHARSIPLVHAIQSRFAGLDDVHDLGDLSLKINGCMNACAHHQLADIGILGVQKNGEEYFQISLGGQTGDSPNLGKIVGPALQAKRIPDAVGEIVALYLSNRHANERFAGTFARIGIDAFKSAIYANCAGRDAA